MNLEALFVKYFNMERVVYDLMDLIDIEVLENYILKEFNDNFSYGELFDLFKNDIGDMQIVESILKDMGHDFINLDKLSDKQKEKYY